MAYHHFTQLFRYMLSMLAFIRLRRDGASKVFYDGSELLKCGSFQQFLVASYYVEFAHLLYRPVRLLHAQKQTMFHLVLSTHICLTSMNRKPFIALRDAIVLPSSSTLAQIHTLKCCRNDSAKENVNAYKRVEGNPYLEFQYAFTHIGQTVVSAS